MVGSRTGNNVSFHLQGGAVLGATVGLLGAAVASQRAVLVLMAAAALAFALWFRGSLWPLITRQRFYESFFAIPGPGPLTYIREGAAAGIVAGGAAGLALGAHLAGLLVWVGGGLLLFRYLETLRYLLATVQSLWRGWGGRPYKRLLAKVHGDRALAERLIAYEGKLVPGDRRNELIERAIARLEHDRRW